MMKSIHSVTWRLLTGVLQFSAFISDNPYYLLLAGICLFDVSLVYLTLKG